MNIENAIWLVALFGIVGMVGTYALEQRSRSLDQVDLRRVARRQIDALVDAHRYPPGIYQLHGVRGVRGGTLGICVLPDRRWTDEYPASAFKYQRVLRPCPSMWRAFVDEQVAPD